MRSALMCATGSALGLGIINSKPEWVLATILFAYIALHMRAEQ